MSYQGFNAYGLNIIVAAFDTDSGLYDTQEAGKSILPLDQMKPLCEKIKGAHRNYNRSGRLRAGCMRYDGQKRNTGHMEFAPVRLNVPEAILVQNENMASSLALLRSHLRERAGL